MTFFEIQTIVVLTTILLEKTNAAEQDPIKNFDIDTTDAINVTEIDKINSGCRINFGPYGARQVFISFRNPLGKCGEITLYVGQDIKTKIAKIDISSAIRIKSDDESLYVVTEMIDVPSGFQVLSVAVDKNGWVIDIEVESIYFIAKKLNSENPYMIISTSNDLGLTIKSWDHRRDKITPILYNSTCEDRQTFHFEQNEMGQFRIIKIYKGITENDVEYLEVRDATRKIGNEIILVKNPGSENNVWSILPGEIDGAVKIKSELTGTCISAVHGLGSNLVLVDCKNGMANEWYLKFCDG